MKHITRREFNRLTAAALGVSPFLLSTAPAEQAMVLLISGQNNHDVERTTAFQKAILDETGLFNVQVSNAPPKDSPESAWASWRPDFESYDVVVSNYNGEPWPDPVKESFEAYIRGGGTALMIHAANNPFPGWTEYELMVGLLWRNNNGGYRIYLEDDGSVVRITPGEGIGAGHGEKHDWPITVRDPDHPIMEGVPETWMHPFDELYHGQRGPAENMHILASAYSSEESGGTGEHEPVIWTIPYGEGTVLTFLPGHLWDDQEDTRAYQCVGLRTLLQRSAEWLATGEVTIPIPDNFPSATEASLVEG